MTDQALSTTLGFAIISARRVCRLLDRLAEAKMAKEPLLVHADGEFRRHVYEEETRANRARSLFAEAMTTLANMDDRDEHAFLLAVFVLDKCIKVGAEVAP